MTSRSQPKMPRPCSPLPDPTPGVRRAQVLLYLDHYTQRMAISNHRVLARDGLILERAKIREMSDEIGPVSSTGE